jgi:hypothetical protein
LGDIVSMKGAWRDWIGCGEGVKIFRETKYKETWMRRPRSS